MNQNIIDKEAGSMYIADDFSIDATTRIADLEDYFGKERLKIKQGYKKYVNVTIYDLKIQEWYFIMTFYYEGDKCTHIVFYPRDEEVNNASWDNFNPITERNYMTEWMAGQLGDTSRFKWDLKQAGRHYHFAYPWGAAGVYYDFKNGTFSCIMNFNT